MNIEEKIKLLKSGKISAVENVKGFLKEIDRNDHNGNKINAFLELNKDILKEAEDVDKKIKNSKAGRLAGLVFSVKSNINVVGMHASCASKVLEDYKCGFDASVIRKIKDEDGLIIGMTNMDEFACGGSGETSAFGPCKNPIALDKIPGGSSSGAAASIAAGFCDLALGSDTGGSIRNPASHCGVVGLKPTYSSVSRYGLIDLSMSLDQIGLLSNDIYGIALVYDIIKGMDERDSISQNSDKIDFEKLEEIPKNIKVGILEIEASDKRIQDMLNLRLKEFQDKYGWKIQKVKISYLDLAVQIYYPLVYTEFFSATRRFDGRRYGKKIEDYAGQEVLRRVLTGEEISKAEYSGRYYHRALKAKQLLIKSFRDTFKKVDCIICPTVPRLPHKIGEDISVEDMYLYDILTAPVNLAGNCAISLPMSRIEGIPVGMQIICDDFNEQKLFEIANSVEKCGL
jgi:aspartyl-tRNA(Asn)/glutamyl-tRNA(Gln) amidotransferase subunit A